MKQKSLILSCVMFFCLMVGVFSTGAATYDMGLEATTDGSTVATNFQAGNVLYLNIHLDAEAGGVAGCAFTLNYDSTYMEAPQTTAEGLPTIEDDITSVFPFKTTVNNVTTKTHRVNSSEVGKIYFSGAEITEAGGSKTHPWDVPLFTIKFKVKDTAPAGNATFSLSQTILTNTAAGWNGEGAPILVGAVPKTDPKFGGDLSDDFPILLASFSDPAPSTMVTIGDLSYSNYRQGILTNQGIDIGGEQEDYDHDGYTNYQEMVNGTDPTADTDDISNVDILNPASYQNLAAKGYNPIKDFRIANLDIDGNGSADLLTDAELLYRRLTEIEMGFDIYSDAEFVKDALGTGATRTTAQQIRAYIDLINKEVYDVDDSGSPTLLGDGTLIQRRITEAAMGFDIYTDDEFVADAVDQYCNRCEAAKIRAYIDQLFPQQ